MTTQNEWWRETAVYHIYPRSFYDSNGDGIGDLNGIISKLDYIKDLGFQTIWLSPHYMSPQRDFGYDISGFRDVAPEYGTLEDAIRLIKEVHKRGMKIIFDMILNHTSDQHPWFLESRSSRTNPKRDWYIWRDGKGKKPPNNWAAIPGGSGWEYDEKTDQWYFHNFLDFQPDLNFRNPEVKAEMFDILRFWLDHGVDGFRLDIFHAIYKDDLFRDNPKSWKSIPNEDLDEAHFQKLKYTLNRPETFELAKEVRSVIDEFVPPRFVIGEVFGKNVIKKYLGENNDGLNLNLLFDLINLKRPSADSLREIVQFNESEYPAPMIPTYGLGNHDRRRYFSRFGKSDDMVHLLAIFVYTIRGVPITYYGDEIGIPDGDFPHSNAKDSLAQPYWWLPVKMAQWLGVYINRDGCRTPMQWNAELNAGFSQNDPWLPVNKDYANRNVYTQSQSPYSLWNTHRNLLHLRLEHVSLRLGAVELIPKESLPNNVLAYHRNYDGQTLSVFLNFSKTKQKVSLETKRDVIFASHKNCKFIDGDLHIAPRNGVITN